MTAATTPPTSLAEMRKGRPALRNTYRQLRNSLRPISNVLQILLMPLIMVGQNIQGSHAELRAEHDLEVNVKAEKEIEIILTHLEYQNAVLVQMMQKLDVKADQVIAATGDS